ncbi:methylmalonyl-CoA mutase small subunit [Bacteroidia bacterium]|nr:methylmalonyl-CoA mutase small subunit [Bacteroidia bacterium]
MKPLFSEFPKVSTEAWEAVINADLKGADYDKKLVWKPAPGVAVRPYYRADDLAALPHTKADVGEFPYVRGTGNHPWKVQQSYCACKDIAAANAKALDGLMKGVEAVGFCLSHNITQSELAQLLKGIYVDAVELNFTPCSGKGSGIQLTQTIVSYLKKSGVDLNKVHISLAADLLKNLTLTGNFKPECFDQLKEAVTIAKDVQHFRNIGVSGSALHNAGATAVQELALALSMGNEYLAQLTDRGLTVDEIAPRIRFTFSVGASYFLEIAKIRAARMLWANIVQAYAPKNDCAAKMHVHAATSAWNQTAYDAYVNMLRGTTEAMSAAIAGVDSLEVLRFDKAFKSPNEFSERIARNAQIILKEESHFDQVTDPAAGSYYIESLTQSLAQEAWNLFKQVEDKGGYVAAFGAGFVQEQVNDAASKRNAALASRRETLLGNNQYPNFTEALGAEAAQHLAQSSGGCGCGGDCGCDCACECEHDGGCDADAHLIAAPLTPYRGAQAFEALRLKTEAAPTTPQAFMLTFGNLAMCRARAQFACNFFAVAGFKVADNNQFASVQEGVKAALAAGAQIVVACSSDEEYADAVPQIASLLAGKAIVVVAGEPECKADLQTKGITHFISIKSNILETLKGYQKELGIDK